MHIKGKELMPSPFLTHLEKAFWITEGAAKSFWIANLRLEEDDQVDRTRRGWRNESPLNYPRVRHHGPLACFTCCERCRKSWRD